jgi:hypothetical protein
MPSRILHGDQGGELQRLDERYPMTDSSERTPASHSHAVELKALKCGRGM